MTDRPGPSRDEAAREAAKHAADPNKLLPGEDPDSMLPDDAEHWAHVYAELLEAKRVLLGSTLEQAAGVETEPARHELEAADAVLIRAEAERLAGRLGYWRRRQEQLRAPDPDSGVDSLPQE